MKKKTMDLILVLIGITVLIFTIAMIWIYLVTGGIPDTLCTCFFVACTGECGFMGWIKTAKVHQQEAEEMKQFYEQLNQQPEFGGDESYDNQ